MPKFIHADLLRQYAEDAAECSEPWLRWQYRVDGAWHDATSTIAFHPKLEFRRKPKTILINGFEVPEPVREPLEKGQEYWVVRYLDEGPARYEWLDDRTDRSWLASGLIHLSKEAAQQHIDALLSFTRRCEG